MSREDIIRMAREANFYESEIGGNEDGFVHFAALVAAAERERIIAENAPVIEKINAHIKALEDERAALAESVQEPQHKPLTTEEVEQLWAQSSWQGRANIGFARAIEKAHGIGV